jgi:hypothetical protein
MSASANADNVIYQSRCIFCKREQYTLAVPAISHGHAGCAWCGRTPPVFTDLQRYRAALKSPLRTEFS